MYQELDKGRLRKGRERCEEQVEKKKRDIKREMIGMCNISE